MGVSQALLAEIVGRILTVAQPDRIILFGSAAKEEMTKDSDIDLLIVEPTPGNRHEEAVRVRDAIGNIDYPVDVLIGPACLRMPFAISLLFMCSRLRRNI